jgi:hypothetical protein
MSAASTIARAVPAFDEQQERVGERAAIFSAHCFAEMLKPRTKFALVFHGFF